MTGEVLIDRYVLGPLLGTGGMGYVHQALDLRMQREVAVKLLGVISPDGESLRRFSREALAAGSLQHPNVVGVFDTGEQQGRPFLVTELLRGETLRQVLQRGPPPIEQTRSWAKQLAAGLAAAHEKGLTHRDLKPSNIFITGDGWVKILDFGLVKLTESLPHEPDAHRVVGTVGYMAPEQVRGQPVDARADLFNFGLVLYEMLSGAPAFADGTDTDTSYAIVVREPKPLPAAVPRDLRALVRRCLAKDREKRPASARELLRLLEKNHAGLSPLRSWAWPGLALLVLASALLTLALRRTAGSGGPIAGTVAIFPFDTHEIGKPSVLASNLNELLNAELVDSGLRPATNWYQRSKASEAAATRIDSARALALKVGTLYFVLGRVEERNQELQLSAALYETESAKRLSQANAHGPPAEILTLVRALSDQLQRRTRSPAESSARLLALQLRTTVSLPALEAWLEGRYLLYYTPRLPEAMERLRQAVVLDPDFTLGWYYLFRGSYFTDLDAAEDAAVHALRHPERLTPAERADTRSHLLRLQGKWQEAAQVLIDATHENPGEAELWELTAASAFHRGPFLGRSPQEATNALQREFELNADDHYTTRRLIELALLRGEKAVVLKLADRLLTLSPKDNEGISMIPYLLARAWAAGDTAGHAALIARLKAHASEIPAVSLVQILNKLTLEMDGSEELTAIASLLKMDAATESALHYQPGFWPVAETYLLRGKIRDARREMVKAVAAVPGENRDFYLPWIDTLELVRPTPLELKTSREHAAQLEVAKDPSRAPAKQFLIGLLALRANDPVAADAALRALQTMPEIPRSTIAADLALSLQARILAARGDPKGALAIFDQQKLQVPERYIHLYGRARENFFRASLLVALGRPREALPLYEALAVVDMVDPVFYPAGHLYTARIHDSLGETELAIQSYERFVAMWKECDPEERPEVLRAQARLLELRQRASGSISEQR